MDLKLTPNEQQFRDEFRAWLKTNLPEEWKGGTSAEDRDDYNEYLRDWQRKLYEGGWAGISWPKEYGGRGAS
jgi:alkylation response protein AidB-like acyl-CoA dehydrogenase